MHEQVAVNMAVLLFELTHARIKLCPLHARLSNLARISSKIKNTSNRFFQHTEDEAGPVHQARKAVNESSASISPNLPEEREIKQG